MKIKFGVTLRLMLPESGPHGCLDKRTNRASRPGAGVSARPAPWARDAGEPGLSRG